MSNTSASLGYANSFGTQNFSTNADLGLVRYANFDVLNRNTYSLGGRLAGDLSPLFYSSINAQLSKLNSTFANQTGIAPNLITSRGFGGSLGFRFNPTWSTFVGLDSTKRGNSSASLNASDASITGKEIGLRYQPQSGLDGSMLIRSVDLKFANSQLLDAFGNPLPFGVNNSSTQTQALLRLSYQPTGISSFAGDVGINKTAYDTLSQRDASGLILNMSYNYLVSDAWSLTAKIGRDTSVSGGAFSSNVQNTYAGVGANWKLTAKTGLRANFDVSKRDFRNDAGVTLGTAVRRQDIVSNLVVGGSYELLRNVNLNMSMARIERDSNVANFSATSTSVLFGVDVALR